MAAATAGAMTARSRALLVLLTLGGITVHQLVLIAPFAAVLLLNPWVHRFGLVGFALVALAFIAWTLQPWHETQGTVLPRDQAPALFDRIDALASRLRATRIDEVRLTDDFNAAALEAPVRWQPWRKRRVLVLGVPLLALTDSETVEAVIAHELGHFSHRHGRFGHWIYRARVGWMQHAEDTVSDSSVLERGAAYFARWFAPHFMRLSFGHSRQCEFEADAAAASATSPLRMAAALMTIEVIGERWHRLSGERLPALVDRQPEPPGAWLAQVQRHVLAQAPRATEWEALEGRRAALHDTHPALGERVGALGVAGEDALRAAAQPGTAAGAAWIADWPAVVGRFDAAWHQAHAAGWRREHLRARNRRAQLEALRSSGDESLLRARLERDHGDQATAVRLASAWTADTTQVGEALYLLGSTQLAAGDVAGVATLEDCIRRDPTHARAARTCLAAHERLLDAAAVKRNRTLLNRAIGRQGRALEALLPQMLGGRTQPARLDDTSWAILREVLHGMPVVAAAWCAGVDGFVHAERRYDAVLLILRLHTARLLAEDRTEDDLRDEALQLLDAVLPAVTLRWVWTAYTTEPLSPELEARLDAWAAAGDPACIVAPKAGESVGPGVRATALG